MRRYRFAGSSKNIEKDKRIQIVQHVAFVVEKRVGPFAGCVKNVAIFATSVVISFIPSLLTHLRRFVRVAFSIIIHQTPFGEFRTKFEFSSRARSRSPHSFARLTTSVPGFRARDFAMTISRVHDADPREISNENGKRDAADDDDADADADAPNVKAAKLCTTDSGDEGRCRAPAFDRRGAALVDGDRIEVEWQLDAASDDDDDDAEFELEPRAPTRVWWPCVVRRANASSDRKGESNAFILEYEAREGFEAERREVMMLPGQRCEDASDAGVLKWRREGDDFEDDDDDDCDSEDDDAPTTMREILEAQGRIDAQGGESLEDASMAAFATLPMDQQMNMASAFAGFKDKLMEKLSGLANQKGANGVVTKDDIESILSDIKNSR